jgi:hypothetical protein
MRTVVVAALVAFVGISVGVSVPAQVEPLAPAAEKPAAVEANAQQFVQMMVQQVPNQDPRIRFAVREALVAMGPQAIPALKEAKEAQPDPHVKAFVGRTLDRIQQMAKRTTKGAMIFPGFPGMGGRDIDRIAMELNLTFEQMAKLEPVFKTFDKQVKDLYAEMKETGAFGDKEAWKDLADERKLMEEETRPKLSAFLDEKQTDGAMRYLRGAGAFGGLPFMIGGDSGAVQIFEGPGGSMGVTIRKTGRVKSEGGGEGGGDGGK